ncbi:MAG: carbohydrate kinase family protein [Candidatus Uhrbacteria bacterium]
MPDVITIGSATRDVFLISKDIKIIRSDKSKTGALECVNLGSKIEIDQKVLTTGGGATNAAATFASLGFDTATIARVGDDSPGRGLIEELTKYKIKTDLIRTVKGGDTAYSVLLTAPTGQRTVLVHRGVSATFSAKDIPWNKLKANWLYLTSLGGNLTLAKKIIKEAYKKNIQVAYNPGMKEIAKGWRAFIPLLPMLSILNMNLEEASTLTGKKEIKEIARAFTKYNLILLITDGANGSYACLGDEHWFAKASKSKVVSRTGAGDAYGSGFVSALIKGKNIPEAMRVATLNAQSVIGSIGAKNGILKHIPANKELKKIKVTKI